MDSRPVSSRTRSKKMKANCEVGSSSSMSQPSRSKKIRSDNGEFTSKKKSFEWVSDDVDSLRKQHDDLGVCDSVAVLVDTDDDDDDDDDDDVSENESDEETVSSAQEDTTEEEIDEECAPSSDEDDTSEEQSEKETEFTETSEKVGEGESVEVDSKRKRNADEDDLHSSSGHGNDDGTDKLGKAESASDKWNHLQKDCKKSEGVSSLTEKKSTRAPKKKRLPTVVFEPPKVEFLPLRFSFGKEPTVPEKSDHDREIDELFDELEFVKAYENGSTDSKAKENNFTRSNRRSDDNDETYTGCPNIGCDKWNGVQKPCERHEWPKKLTKKKCTRARKDANVFKILANSIYEDEEVPLEGSGFFGDEAPTNETLPLKFSFDEPPSIVPDKSDCEKELDELLKEMDFAFRTAEIGSTDYNVVENIDSPPQVESNDSSPPVKEVFQATLCSQGKHHLILDDEIGLICRFCPHVHLEIKYIVPEFASNPYGRSGKRFYEEDNWSIPDELQCHDSGFGFNSHAHVEGTVWDLIPGVKNSMYPHQREGFEFIWSHIAGAIHIEKLQKASSADGGHGCIISHAPGTGKTRLTIIFLQAYMKFNPKCRPLIIAPRTMLLTWEEEFKKWGFDIPFHNLNNQSLSGKENKEALRILVQDGGQRRVKSLDGCRWLKLYSWKRERSILGISYRLFEQLSAVHHSGLAETMRNILLDFPGIVVFDEGHTPRNDKSLMWKASLNIKTNRRIILSGTPFQNNFDELYNTICLARPDWIRPTCSGQDQKRNVVKAQQTSLVNYISKGAHDKSEQAKEIRARISPIVHVYRGSILQDTLPGLKNSVVVLQPTNLQRRFSKIIQEKKNLPLFEDEYYETLISVHPSAFLNLEKKRVASLLNQVDLDSLKEERLNPEAGRKAKFVIELIRLSDAMNERVLVFSQYINALTFLRELLISQFQWTQGEEILSMNGADDEKQRQSSMKAFNDPSSKAKVLLASIKGCNEGISLVGASRVVLLDVTWNPSVERQAICRAYRLGQKKIVYIYHLLLARPREEEKYSRQVEKHKLSELVFSCSENDGGRKKIRAVVSEDKILEEMVQHEKLKHIFEKITLLDEGLCFDKDKVL